MLLLNEHIIIELQTIRDKIDALIAGLKAKDEDILQRDSSSSTLMESSEAAVTFREDGVPVFHRQISSKSRTEQQERAVLLYMGALPQEARMRLTTNKISAVLLRSGIPPQRMNAAYGRLRSGGFISSKPKKQEIFLTPDGEAEAKRLAGELPRK